MKRSSISSIFGFLIVIGIVSSIFTRGEDIFTFGTVLPVIIGLSALSSIFRGLRNKQNQNPGEKTQSNNTRFTRQWYATPKKQNKCEYCGEFNDSDREYCENCGAKQLPN